MNSSESANVGMGEAISMHDIKMVGPIISMEDKIVFHVYMKKPEGRTLTHEYPLPGGDVPARQQAEDDRESLLLAIANMIPLN